MSAWIESASEHFSARHDEGDGEAAGAILAQLEATRARLAERFDRLPAETVVVVHGSEAQLALARPEMVVWRRLTAPAARRYVAGSVARGRDGFDELHVLTPSLLEARTGAHDPLHPSRAMLDRVPSVLFARLVVLESSPALRSRVRALRWAWLLSGAAAWFGGQTQHARAAISLRLHEPPQPSFPPGVRDAELLGGTVIDLLAREEGEDAAVALATHLHSQGSKSALIAAFAGRSLVHTEGTWRAHLARMAEREGSP